MVKYSSGLEIFGVIQGYTLTLDWKDIVYNATISINLTSTMPFLQTMFAVSNDLDLSALLLELLPHACFNTEL